MKNNNNLILTKFLKNKSADPKQERCSFVDCLINAENVQWCDN